MALDNLPPGLRFNPTAEELLMRYLLPRIREEPVPCGDRLVKEVELYGRDDPWTLFGVTDGSEEHCFFVFTDLKTLSVKKGRRKRNGRKTRGAGSGVWSSRTVNDVIDSEGNIIGEDRYYIFSTGEDKKKKKKKIKKGRLNSGASSSSDDDDERRDDHGHWTMHEYCLVDSKGRCLDDVAVCVVACNTQILIKHSAYGNSKKRRASATKRSSKIGETSSNRIATEPSSSASALVVSETESLEEEVVSVTGKVDSGKVRH